MTADYREFHGIRVPDPFRWLEQADDARVQAWVNGREIWVVVSENPDGAAYVFSNSSAWRWGWGAWSSSAPLASSWRGCSSDGPTGLTG